jgi:hypothetical protein
VARDLLTTRLAVQRLTGTPFRTAQEAVRFFGAVQAQDYPGAKWSLGMRVKDATDRTIDAALAAGKIIRTHVLRPTWHFVTPEDLRWMLALSAPQVNRLGSYQYQELELGPKLFTKVHTLLQRGLAGGQQLTRAEVAQLLARGKIVGDGRRVAHILMEAELAGLVCSGAPRGKQQTYALVEEWVAPGPRYTRAEAVALLAQRFFASHGPATLKQFAWWSGLTVTEARKGREALRGVESEAVNGVEWISPLSRSTTDQKPTTLLIPEYDEVLTGWADIGIPRSIADRRRGKPTNTFDRPILYGGKWVGTWRRTIGPRVVGLELELFGRSSESARSALAREVARYEAFLGRKVAVSTAT